jgi:peptidyl-tRNA hydrolase, PTH1 family
MRLIVGLGNPGKEYEWTRHNLGFMVIDKLAEHSQVTLKRRQCESVVATAEVAGGLVKLAKPQTYMNLSGRAIACLFSLHRIAVGGDNLIVISDDMALPFGKIRIRPRGSAGGHNGLKSIIAAIGPEFVRLRIGIQPEHPVADARGFVLGTFPRSVRAEVEATVERSAAAVDAILSDGVASAMARYN